MGTRGRNSGAELSLVPIGVDNRRPAAPACLNNAEAATWTAVVADLPGGWVTPAQEGLLIAYCWHVEAGTRLSREIDSLVFASCDHRRLGRLLEMRRRETSASASLATKLRLTAQSRMHARTAGRRTDGHPGGARPWDQDADR